MTQSVLANSVALEHTSYRAGWLACQTAELSVDRKGIHYCRIACAGEVVDDAESKRRMAEAKASGEHNFYMMEMAPGLIIDARTKWALHLSV